MRFLCLAWLLFSLMLLGACDNEAIRVDTPETDTVKLLKRYTILDTSMNAPQDTLFTQRIVYDRDVRRVMHLVGKSHTPRDSFYSIEDRYYANKTDMQPVRRTINYYNSTYTVAYDSTFQYFRYDADNRMVYDSARIFYGQILASYVYEYNYTGNNVLAWVHRPWRRDTVSVLRSVNSVVNNNVVSSSTTVRDSGSTTLNSIQSDFVYDNNRNPLWDLSIKQPVVNDLGYFFNYGLLHENARMQHNNLTGGTLKVNGTALPVYNMQYQYDARGNPLAAWFTDTQNIFTTGGKRLKVVYTYY